MSLLGGPPEIICALDAPLMGASWGANDTIIFGSAYGAEGAEVGLFRVAARGGEAERITTPDEARSELHGWPEILPGGTALLFTVLTGTSGSENARIALLDLETREHVPLIPTGSQPRYVGTGHIVYGTEGALSAVMFDITRLAVTGAPTQVRDGGLTKSTGAAEFSVSNNGSLVYVPGGADVGAIGWVNREGQMTPWFEGEALILWPRRSPDGARAAFSMVSELGADIWIRDLRRGSNSRLTDVGGTNVAPVWTPDSATVTFTSDRAGGLTLYSKPADGSAEAQALAPSEVVAVPGSWSTDGRTLVYYKPNGVSMERDIWTYSLGGGPKPLLDTPFNELAPRLSPDGHWVAYVSDLTGEDRVYVQAFPEGGEAIPVSTGRGTEPVWSSDGRSLFYRDGSQLLEVGLDTEPAFTVESPAVVFDVLYARNPSGVGAANYDVSEDGRLVMVRSTGADTATVRLELNWFEELQRLAPLD